MESDILNSRLMYFIKSAFIGIIVVVYWLSIFMYVKSIKFLKNNKLTIYIRFTILPFISLMFTRLIHLVIPYIYYKSKDFLFKVLRVILKLTGIYGLVKGIKKRAKK